MKKKLSLFEIVLICIMLLFMALIIVPFAHIIAVSLSSSAYVMTGQVSVWPKGFTTIYYEDILKQGDFLQAYGNTITYTVLGTALSLTTTAMAAYALSRKQVIGHKLITAMITLTMFIGGGMIPNFITVMNYGLLDTIWAVLLPGMISTWNLIVMRSFFIAYPKEIIESGMLDGLQDAGVFFCLVLPTSKAALATIGLYYAVAKWNSYLQPFLYLNDSSKYPVQLLLRQMLTSAATESQADAEAMMVPESVKYACIVVTALPVMCVYPFIQKYFVKGVMVGSIKG